MDSTIVDRVAAGAAWLDQNRPGWADRIDLDRLHMRNACRCILGQEYGSYYKAPITMDQAVNLGFDAQGAAQGWAEDDDFAALDDAWTALIEARRADAAVTT